MQLYRFRWLALPRLLKNYFVLMVAAAISGLLSNHSSQNITRSVFDILLVITCFFFMFVLVRIFSTIATARAQHADTQIHLEAQNVSLLGDNGVRLTLDTAKVVFRETSRGLFAEFGSTPLFFLPNRVLSSSDLDTIRSIASASTST